MEGCRQDVHSSKMKLKMQGSSLLFGTSLNLYLLTKNADAYNNHLQNRNAIPFEKLGGISSAEHDEALMAEAIKVGGIPEGSICGFPNDFMQKSVSCLRPAPLPPSPSLSAQCLIREQQDDEYLKSLQADIEKEPRALEEAKAAREEERRRTEESQKKLQQEKEMSFLTHCLLIPLELERQLAAKEPALPPEPSLDDENAVTLLVKMPDGNYRGRRFLKSDNLQSVFDFIDIGRVVEPGTYRLERPYPRRSYSDGEGAWALNEVGMTDKQQVLFLELI